MRLNPIKIAGSPNNRPSTRLASQLIETVTPLAVWNVVGERQEELMARAREMAEVLASKPRNALFETKRLTRELIDLPTKTALNEIGATFRRCLESNEHKKRVVELYEGLKRKG